jgi:hypothetical protein
MSDWLRPSKKELVRRQSPVPSTRIVKAKEKRIWQLRELCRIVCPRSHRIGLDSVNNLNNRNITSNNAPPYSTTICSIHWNDNINQKTHNYQSKQAQQMGELSAELSDRNSRLRIRNSKKKKKKLVPTTSLNMSGEKTWNGCQHKGKILKERSKTNWRPKTKPTIKKCGCYAFVYTTAWTGL